MTNSDQTEKDSQIQIVSSIIFHNNNSQTKHQSEGGLFTSHLPHVAVIEPQFLLLNFFSKRILGGSPPIK